MAASQPQASRLTTTLLMIIAAGVWGLLVRTFLPLRGAEAKSVARAESLETLTVQRINVVDADGKTRLVIANGSHFPPLVARGKTYPERSIRDAAGIIYNDAEGNEIGGLAIAKLRDENVVNSTFDYGYQPTDGVYMIRRESEDGKRWQAGFGISDRRPFQPGGITSSQGVPRIALMDQNQDAHLVISDPEGRPRIRIGVDPSGEPLIETLNGAGQVTYRAGK